MPPLVWDSRPDGLRAPALICAFKGWNDAGDAASAAVQFVGASHNATRFAQIDPEDFYDFQATRPRIKLVDGRTRELSWPSVEIYEARIPRAPRDLVLLTGPEPSFRWRSFCKIIVELAEAMGVQLVVTAGALHQACAEAGLPSASLWASVPHYVAAAPNPKAALALVRRLEGVVGVTVDAMELEQAAGDYERQVSLAVQ